MYKASDTEENVTAHAHNIPPSLQVPIAQGNVAKIEKQLKRIMKCHLPSKAIKNTLPITMQLDRILKERLKVSDNVMYRLHVENNEGKQISTPVMKDPTTALDIMIKNQIVPKSKAYELEDFQISKLHLAPSDRPKCAATAEVWNLPTKNGMLSTRQTPEPVAYYIP